MDSPITNTLANVAGRGVGVLAALDSIKSGGLGSYLIQREKAIADPDIRANLIGSPFAAGMLQVSGDTAPARVATPDDFVGPPSPAPAVAGPSDIAYLAPSAPDRRWTPNLPPLSTAEQVKQATEQGTLSGLRGGDIVARIQAKLGAKIPLTNDELAQAVGGAKYLQAQAGPGSTVGLSVPGMPIQVGSPYNLSSMGPEEYPTPDAAAAAASQRPGYRVVPSGRGTWLLAPPPTREQTLPQTPPPPAMTPPLTTTPGARMSQTAGPTVAERTNNPGNIKDSVFARTQPGYVGVGPAATDGGSFAVFDSPASGANAMSNLLRGPGYSGLTVDQGLTRWSNGGYGGEVGAAVGIDPSRRIGDLNDAERGVLATGMARREGFRGSIGATAATPPAAVAAAEPVVTAPVQTAAVAPPPPPPPPPPPTPRRPAPVVVASATPAPTFDPNATVPHVMVPAQTAAPEVGFPPPAPGPPATTPVPVLRTPTAPAAPVPAAPAPPLGTMPAPAAVLPGIPIDPSTNLPLQGRTVESQSGSNTYSAPNLGDVPTQLKLRWAGITNPLLADPAQIANYYAQERAITQRKEMDSADIARLRRGLSEGEETGLTQLVATRSALNDFLTKYPDAPTRAQFVGVLNAPIQTAEQFLQLPWAGEVAAFRTALAPIAPDTFTSDEKARTLLSQDMGLLRPVAPSVRDSPELFEAKLQSFRDRLDDQIAIRNAMRGMAAGDITGDVVNGWLDQLQQTRLAARMAAFAPPVAPAAAPAPPPAAAPPPPAAGAWAPDWVR